MAMSTPEQTMAHAKVEPKREIRSLLAEVFFCAQQKVAPSF
jgi:hypothetical protein